MRNGRVSLKYISDSTSLLSKNAAGKSFGAFAVENSLCWWEFCSVEYLSDWFRHFLQGNLMNKPIAIARSRPHNIISDILKSMKTLTSSTLTETFTCTFAFSISNWRFSKGLVEFWFPFWTLFTLLIGTMSIVCSYWIVDSFQLSFSNSFAEFKFQHQSRATSNRHQFEKPNKTLSFSHTVLVLQENQDRSEDL